MKNRLCSLKEIIHYVYLTVLSISLIVSLSAPCVKVSAKKMTTCFNYRLARKISIWSRYGIQVLLFIFVAAACFNFIGIKKSLCSLHAFGKENDNSCNKFSGSINYDDDDGLNHITVEWGPKSGFVFSTLSVVLVWSYIFYLGYIFWDRCVKISFKASRCEYNPNQQGPGYAYVDQQQQQKDYQESLISHNPDDYDKEI
ncbi:hypothetical protein DFA_11512 [Cavenderia fasciculata]|uniref:Uncharacterized protein n=1 Tax=Cavenderia fasciculata TaxID=261658 RepID=F4QDC3_CACFS|nr:uncharacterized protein DFA_11512 [Cavenderia fasciculata]EGG13751.1 hypothetical protein DFA_11512 [Cavenderia fasciculata]|eukprot:XP_004350459.1 hypothetical protein DFA_11512 [Cavenderia fasciculata]